MCGRLCPLQAGGSGSETCPRPGNWARGHDLSLGPPGHGSLSSPGQPGQSPGTWCSVTTTSGASGPWPGSNLLFTGATSTCRCRPGATAPTISSVTTSPRAAADRGWGGAKRMALLHVCSDALPPSPPPSAVTASPCGCASWTSGKALQPIGSPALRDVLLGPEVPLGAACPPQVVTA